MKNEISCSPIKMCKCVTPSMLTSLYDRSDFLAFAEPQSINLVKGSEGCV